MVVNTWLKTSSIRPILVTCQRTLLPLSNPLCKGAETNLCLTLPRAVRGHLPYFASPTFCGGRRIGCVTTRRWRPETTALAGGRLERPSEESHLRVQSTDSARQPRSADQ